jgi:hypothetical protein
MKEACLGNILENSVTQAQALIDPLVVVFILKLIKITNMYQGQSVRLNDLLLLLSCNVLKLNSCKYLL